MELKLTKEQIQGIVDFEAGAFSDTFYSKVLDDWLALHTEVELLTERLEKAEAVIKAAQSLYKSIPDFILEESRDLWSNTNVNVVLHWKMEFIKALVNLEGEQK